MSNKMGKMRKRRHNPKRTGVTILQDDEPVDPIQPDDGSVHITSPEQGAVKIFLDDERECPEGWLLCRTIREFFTTLSELEEKNTPVIHLSLDYYLSNGLTGAVVAEELIGHFHYDRTDDRPYLPDLRQINFHSSDKDMARKMAVKIRTCLEELGRTNIRLRLGLPR